MAKGKFAGIPSWFLENPKHLSGRLRIPTRMDWDRTLELFLNLSSSRDNFPLEI